MIINGLGFTQNPIYLSPTFFEGKDVCALIGEGIEAQHLNDDAHGRTLNIGRHLSIRDYSSVGRDGHDLTNGHDLTETSKIAQWFKPANLTMFEW
jgi:hypothetical protein